MTVLVDAIWTIMPKPVIVMKTIDPGSQRESANPIKPPPNTTVFVRITRPSPTTDFLVVTHSAPQSAPNPEAPTRNPRVYGPPPRISSAKTGISTENGMATRHNHASWRISDRMGRNPNTYLPPSGGGPRV